MRKSKNRNFYHIFVSPGDAPGAITLILYGWKENAMLTNCLAACAHNRFWDTARYWSKIVILSYPLAIDAPVRGVPVGISAPLRYGKTRMVSLSDGEKISKICLFVLTWSTNVTDRRTDRRTDTAWQQRPRLCIASRGKNWHHITCCFM